MTTIATKSEIESCKNQYQNYKIINYTNNHINDLNENINYFIKRIEKKKKNYFEMNSGNIKITTTHSFKGMENLNVFLLIDKNDDPEIVYTGITRLIKNLIIIASKDSKYDYEKFFKPYVNNKFEVTENGFKSAN